MPKGQGFKMTVSGPVSLDAIHQAAEEAGQGHASIEYADEQEVTESESTITVRTDLVDEQSFYDTLVAQLPDATVEADPPL